MFIKFRRAFMSDNMITGDQGKFRVWQTRADEAGVALLDYILRAGDDQGDVSSVREAKDRQSPDIPTLLKIFFNLALLHNLPAK